MRNCIRPSSGTARCAPQSRSEISTTRRMASTTLGNSATTPSPGCDHVSRDEGRLYFTPIVAWQFEEGKSFGAPNDKYFHLALPVTIEDGTVTEAGRYGRAISQRSARCSP